MASVRDPDRPVPALAPQAPDAPAVAPARDRRWLKLPREDGFRILEIDGTETAIFARHDVVELFHGRKTMVAMSITTGVALSLIHI